MSKHLYMDGEWVVGEGEPLSSTCPATGRRVWEGRSATPAQVDVAAAAARRASPGWSRTPFSQRVALMERYKSALSARAPEMARTISQEIGKPLWEAHTEVTSMVNKVDISLKAYAERTGSKASDAADGKNMLSHRPHGVLGVLGPYNFPGHLPNGHIVPALIAGNTVLFKPSEYAPHVATLMAQCWEEAGLPAGVFNVLIGARPTGEALVGHAEVDGILMTGSYATGVALSRRLAGQPEKLLALEMGGNNPLVVWGVENIEAAVMAIIQSAYISAGQRCTCARRLIVSDGDEGRRVLERLLAVLKEVRVGAWDGTPEPFMGPVVGTAVAASLLAAQEALLEQGARALMPMRQLVAGTGFLSPGVLDLTEVLSPPDEELFGPLLSVYRVASFDAAIALANRTRYGLAAGLLADREAHWTQFASEVRAGVVNWNKPTTGAASTAPFGGTGRSGNHRPSAFYAADYCAYPVASVTSSQLTLPKVALPGLPISV